MAPKFRIEIPGDGKRSNIVMTFQAKNKGKARGKAKKKLARDYGWVGKLPAGHRVIQLA